MSINFNKLKKVPKKDVKKIHHILYDLTKKGYKVYEGYVAVHGIYNAYGVFKTYICDDDDLYPYAYEEPLKEGSMHYRPINSVDNNFITIKPTIIEAEKAIKEHWSGIKPQITHKLNY